MVIVNTVVNVRSLLGLGERSVAVALAVFGAGSMIGPLARSRLLDRVPDRPVMLAGAAGLVAGFGVIGAASLAGLAGWWTLLAIWFLIGLSRLIKRSSHEEDRPALFAAV